MAVDCNDDYTMPSHDDSERCGLVTQIDEQMDEIMEMSVHVNAISAQLCGALLGKESPKIDHPGDDVGWLHNMIGNLTFIADNIISAVENIQQINNEGFVKNK